jgi:hypothetical protein
VIPLSLEKSQYKSKPAEQSECYPVLVRQPALPIHGSRIDANPLCDQNPPQKTNSGEASNDTSPLGCEIKNSPTWD